MNNKVAIKTLKLKYKLEKSWNCKDVNNALFGPKDNKQLIEQQVYPKVQSSYQYWPILFL